MNPQQMTLIEWTVRRTRRHRVEIAADFYARLCADQPSLRAQFADDPDEQARTFAAELDAIINAMRRCRHDNDEVEPSHDASTGVALLGALAAALGPAWTPTVEEAWRSGLDLVTETAGVAE